MTLPDYPLLGPVFIEVIIPFRNEAANLPRLFDSLCALTYPAAHLQITFVDDHSTDGGADWLRDVAVDVQPFPPALRAQPVFQLYRLADYPEEINPRAYKKSALALAIRRSAADLIVTTDADCTWRPDTLQWLADGYRRGNRVLLGSVRIDRYGSFNEAFQALDVAAFQWLTRVTAGWGRPALANGACFAFDRQLFVEVGGYAGVDHLPSGDDVLLLHKFNQHQPPPPANYVLPPEPGALVATQAVPSWAATWRQRLRWAGKAGNYANPLLTAAQAGMYLLCLGVLAGLVTSLFLPALLLPTLAVWAVKTLIEGTILLRMTRQLGQGNVMWWYLPVQLIYPVYIVAIGTAALLGVGVKWKGRS